MLTFANEGLMIPEQIWDTAETPKNADRNSFPKLKFGEGTGSATPLAWSMAQFIRLAVNLQEGRNLDTPDVVYNRYVLGKKSEDKSQNSEFILTQEQVDCLAAQSIYKAERLAQKFPVTKRCGEKTHYAVFAYEGNAEKVEVVGDFTNWKPNDLFLRQENVGPAGYENNEYELIKNKKYRVMEFAPTARVEYKLIVDGKWITDPLNPNKVDNGVGGENSVLTMPDYKATVWDKEFIKTPTVPGITDLEIESSKFGKRTVKVFVPSIYYKRSVLQKLPVLYLQDGSEYIARAKAINILENLTMAKKVEPFMIVFIDPKDRMKEYWANDDWADFVALEVVPAVEKKYFSVIKTGRENRALLGASLGGITSVWTALRHPDVFARVGGQSSSFWIDNERVVKELAKLDAEKTKFRFYFDDGTLEGAEDTRRVSAMLRGKGFPVVYAEGETGHNWTSWRDRLADAFVALWAN